MLHQKVNTWLSIAFVASFAFGASFLIIQVSKADDLEFSSFSQVSLEDRINR